MLNSQVLGSLFYKSTPKFTFRFIPIFLTLVMCSMPTLATDSDADIISANLIKPVVVKGEAAESVSVQQRMKQLNVPGVSVAVVKNGKLAWARVYGAANTQSQRAVNEDTLFQAGSISKPIAALAALKLVDEGKIALDSDVNQYLKGWQVSGEKAQVDILKNNPVTLRHLLTHSGGLTVHGFPGYPTGSDIPSTTDVLNGEGNTDRVLVNMTPGTEFRYSGGGYTIMQKIVEDVTGQSFAEYTDDNILKPMGMNSSTYQHNLPKSLKNRASAAFDNEGKMFEQVYNDYPEKAAAGLWTTASDLAKYVLHMQAIVRGDFDDKEQVGILSKSIVEAMFTKHKADYGLGPQMMDGDGQLLFGHGGKNLGFTNFFKGFVYKGDGVIVMTNGDNGGDLINEILTTVSEFYQLGFDKQTVLESVSLSDAELDALVGDYKLLYDIGFDGDFIVKIRIIDGQLTTSTTFSTAPGRLVPTEKLHFVNIKSRSPHVFSKDADGKVVGLMVSNQFELVKL